MPKELTHWIIADKTRQRLSGSGIGATVAAHRAEYLAGAVLPDTLLHVFRGPHARVALGLSHHFHDPPHDSYLPLVQAWQKAGSLPAPVFACLLGVVSHMQADMAIHPNVFARTGKKMGEHYRLETRIDTDFLRRGETPPVRRMRELVTPATRGALVEALGLVFDPEGRLPRATLERALELHCRFQGMYDRLPWKVFAGVVGRICGAPFSDQRHLFYPLVRRGRPQPEPESWRHPGTGEQRRETVSELAECAAQRTAELFRRIEEKGFVAALSEAEGKSLINETMNHEP
ncbi:zinc dependent phospholipase C family protein [Geomesophilobacter sediminis]|uniref:Zinc dependent phospholipase C family protein n=1 Tax=Geomesophilobacter sediminis TaxID=2798584 RepID=A0A8J7M344_9BACT|nr:zinc dependent phospholipase C family protein [Geomesophilobacter sediminis]MBJ6727772.1 zinc dependent phospholipase C family protein [Geomesophilobacter sediminis]